MLDFYSQLIFYLNANKNPSKIHQTLWLEHDKLDIIYSCSVCHINSVLVFSKSHTINDPVLMCCLLRTMTEEGETALLLTLLRFCFTSFTPSLCTCVSLLYASSHIPPFLLALHSLTFLSLTSSMFCPALGIPPSTCSPSQPPSGSFCPPSFPPLSLSFSHFLPECFSTSSFQASHLMNYLSEPLSGGALLQIFDHFSRWAGDF